MRVRTRSPSIVALLIGVLATGARVSPAHADDVTVTGAARQAGTISIRGDDVRQMPGTFGDPGRVIEAAPGVAPMLGPLPFYFVRGATPSNTGYFLDGMRLPLFSHSPPGGGVVAASLVDRVDFFPGAAPAQFGSVAGGVLSIATRPPEVRPHGEIGVKLYDTSALVETPLADGRASVLASGRYGYTQLIFDVIDPASRQSYWDYYTRATLDVGDGGKDRVSIVAVGAHDYVGYDGETVGDATFHRAELRYDRKLGGGGRARVAATLGSTTQANEAGSVTSRLAGLRAETAYPLGRAFELGTGAAATFERYDVEVNPRAGPPVDTNVVFAPRSDVSQAVFGDLRWRPVDAIDVTGGVRATLFGSQRDRYPRFYALGTDIVPSSGGAAKVGIDPRLAVRTRLSRGITFFSAIGVASAPPTFLVPGLAVSRLDDGLQTSLQTGGGVEIALPFTMSLRLSGFVHDYLNLSDPAATCPDFREALFNPVDACFARRVRGRSFGGEVLLRRPLTERLSGWLSYTLSRTTRQAHAPGWTIRGESMDQLPEVLSEFDRTHVLTAMGSYDFGRGWRGAVRFSYSTGRPFSPTRNGVLVGPYTSERLPDTHRVDVRLEKRWSLGRERSVALVVEGFNVTLFRDTIQCTPNRAIALSPVPRPFVTGRPLDTCSFDRLPAYAIPSVGLEAVF